MDLLGKAKAYRFEHKGPKFVPSKEHLDWAIAWAKNEISFTQAMVALTGKKNRSAQMYATLALSLKAALTQGRLLEKNGRLP